MERTEQDGRREIRLIALDLDGTLLNSDKQLTPANAQALASAAGKGIEIVPATGRFFAGMPECIRALPFVRYAITINGAAVYDAQRSCDLVRQEIPLAQAVQIMQYLDTLPVIYDSYVDNWGYMTRQMQLRAAEFAPNGHYLRMLRELRTPVDELKAFLQARGGGVQKIQLFTYDKALRQQLLEQLPERFAGLSVTSSVSNNIEINSAGANKGAALLALASALHIAPEETMAFGDGLNDVTMLRAAGVGVAMANGCAGAKQAADFVTASCDEDGVAAAIAQVCL